MQLSQEQRAVVDCSAASISVQAYAGTGKTSTLVEWCRARPDLRILYLAFNKSMADQAKTKMPSHVSCMTSHSLAFRSGHGSRLQHKLANYPLKAWHLKKVIEDNNLCAHLKWFEGLKTMARVELAKQAMSMVDDYTHSELTSIRELPPVSVGFFKHRPHQVYEMAELLWSWQCDPSNTLIPATHDTYFKLYALDQPDLSSSWDAILLDEAQDTNPALWGLFSAQTNIKHRILVGDWYQNIYSFRGAMNAMQAFSAEHKLRLTQSWRFGSDLAWCATQLLHDFFQEPVPLQGLESAPEVPENPQTAWLYRTNAGLFDRYAESFREKNSVHFLGGVQNYRFDEILDTYYLYDDRKKDIKNSQLKGFKNFKELAEYADQFDDKEILARIRVVKKYTSKIPQLVADSVGAHCNMLNKSPAVLSTVHRAKGSEFDVVNLGDDFSPLLDKKTRQPRTNYYATFDKPIEDEEVRLWYVAITRAKYYLVPNKDLENYLNWVVENRKI